MVVGTVFLGRYEAIRLLGEGGMGRVYLARQRDLDRPVVVKVMHEHVAQDPRFRERFQREILLMARFTHPYAVTLFDASLDDICPCLVMEYIRGVTLDTLLHRHGRLNPFRVGRLLGQLCEVLYLAHTEGIIHRDLKPANLMVIDADTPYERIKVMDFGLAKSLDPRRKMNITEANAEFGLGTPNYICPELVRGEEMDHRGDLYSVGVILYELLTGGLPFCGRTTMDILLAHATEAPPAFATRGTSQEAIPPTVEKVVQACLAKNADQRPSSARELAERYEVALLEEQGQAPAQAHSTAVVDDTLTPDSQVAANSSPEVDASKVFLQDMEAWMPEQIATHKLRGFVEDVGGEVLESVPGLIRVRFGNPGTRYGEHSPGPLSWLGIGRRSRMIDMELYLKRSNPGKENLLRVTVVMRPTQKGVELDPEMRGRCKQVFVDLRSYLIVRAGPEDQVG